MKCKRENACKKGGKGKGRNVQGSIYGRDIQYEKGREKSKGEYVWKEHMEDTRKRETQKENKNKRKT